MKKILIDLNVLLDFLNKRNDHLEAAKIVDGRLRNYGYKNLNLLIQGGSADITKEAMLIFDSLDPVGHLILQVYDEIVVDTPDHKHDMPLLRFAMESSFKELLDLPMPTDGEYSRRSWGRMKPYREKASAF